APFNSERTGEVGYSFTSTETLTLTTIRTIGGSTSNLSVAIYADNSRSPGTQLTTLTLPSNNNVIMDFVLPTPFVILANETYYVGVGDRFGRERIRTTFQNRPTGTNITFGRQRFIAISSATNLGPYVELVGRVGAPTTDTNSNTLDNTDSPTLFDVYPGLNDGRLLPNLSSRVNAYIDDNGTVRAYYTLDTISSELVTTESCTDSTQRLLAENELMQIWCLESNEYQFVDLSVDPIGMRRDNLIISADGTECRRVYFYIETGETEIYDTGCFR
ncbi:MAG: choice-of-anchor R domain-containing protein, partial [Chloroflexota bacterium]